MKTLQVVLRNTFHLLSVKTLQTFIGAMPITHYHGSAGVIGFQGLQENFLRRFGAGNDYKGEISDAM